jgi:hypothetical protein
VGLVVADYAWGTIGSWVWTTALAVVEGQTVGEPLGGHAERCDRVLLVEVDRRDSACDAELAAILADEDGRGAALLALRLVLDPGDHELVTPPEDLDALEVAPDPRVVESPDQLGGGLLDHDLAVGRSGVDQAVDGDRRQEQDQQDGHDFHHGHPVRGGAALLLVLRLRRLFHGVYHGPPPYVAGMTTILIQFQNMSSNYTIYTLQMWPHLLMYQLI